MPAAEGPRAAGSPVLRPAVVQPAGPAGEAEQGVEGTLHAVQRTLCRDTGGGGGVSDHAGRHTHPSRSQPGRLQKGGGQETRIWKATGRAVPWGSRLPLQVLQPDGHTLPGNPQAPTRPRVEAATPRASAITKGAGADTLAPQQCLRTLRKGLQLQRDGSRLPSQESPEHRADVPVRDWGRGGDSCSVRVPLGRAGNDPEPTGMRPCHSADTRRHERHTRKGRVSPHASATSVGLLFSRPLASVPPPAAPGLPTGLTYKVPGHLLVLLKAAGIAELQERIHVIGARLQQNLRGRARHKLRAAPPGPPRRLPTPSPTPGCACPSPTPGALGPPHPHPGVRAHHNVVGLHGLHRGQELVLRLLVLLVVLEGKAGAALLGLQQPHGQTWGGPGSGRHQRHPVPCPYSPCNRPPLPPPPSGVRAPTSQAQPTSRHPIWGSPTTGCLEQKPRWPSRRRPRPTLD